MTNNLNIKSDKIWLDEINSYIESSDPIDTQEKWDVNGIEVEVLFYNSGSVKTWVKGIGSVGSVASWQKKTSKEFYQEIKLKLQKY